MSGEPALTAEEAAELREVFSEVSIAPLGRNFFDRYREIRDAIDEMCGAVEGGVEAEELREHLDAEDVDFIRSIAENLETFAEDGTRRQGEVEPYVSARADAERLAPFVELLEPHVG